MLQGKVEYKKSIHLSAMNVLGSEGMTLNQTR